MEIFFFLWQREGDEGRDEISCKTQQIYFTSFFFSPLSFFLPSLCVRGGPLPAGGRTEAAGGAGGKQTGVDLPGWRQLASAVPLDSQQQQPHRLDAALQVSCHAPAADLSVLY